VAIDARQHGVLYVDLCAGFSSFHGDDFETVPWMPWVENHAFKSDYDALSGVDKEFIAGIQSMQKGKAPIYTFDPAPVPDWPDDPTKSGLLLAAWASIKPVLEVLLNKISSGGALATTIAGLLVAGDKCAAELEKAFSK
jgi:hypothetical protein